jgi:uncharacterized membrane protein
MKFGDYLRLRKALKRATSYIIRTTTSGLFLVLPLLVLVILCVKAGQVLLPPTRKLADAIGLRAISVNILLVILLILACFIAGFLIRAQSVRRAKNWLENNILNLIPGYEYIRMRLVSSLETEAKESPEIVLINYDDCLHPAMIIERNENGTCVVFIPNAPDIKEGSVVIAEPKMMQPLNISMTELTKCLRNYGKGILKEKNREV